MTKTKSDCQLWYMELYAFTYIIQPGWPLLRLKSCSVSKATFAGVPVRPKHHITVSVRRSGSCAIIRVTAVGVCCILSVWNYRTTAILDFWEGSAV